MTSTSPTVVQQPHLRQETTKRDAAPTRAGLKRLAFENGLSLVLVALFVVTWVAQSVSGMKEFNEEQREHSQPEVGYGEYLRTGHFIEATGENWESEFLQMAMFVWLTTFLRQKGSSESKKLDEEEAEDRDPAAARDNPDAPWPVRKGGPLVLWLYSHSLCLAFLAMFLACFLLHAAGGAREHSQDQEAHGQPGVTMVQYMGTAKFWHESMQNWQSEFLSLAAMVVLSIWLRQRGSPESKPVDAPHSETGR